MLPHRETSDFDSDSSSSDTKLDLSELSLSDDDEVQEYGTLTHVERDAALTQLKTYGSDPKDADPLFTSKVQSYPAHITQLRRMRSIALPNHNKPLSYHNGVLTCLLPGNRNDNPPRPQLPLLHHQSHRFTNPSQQHAPLPTNPRDLRLTPLRTKTHSTTQE